MKVVRISNQGLLLTYSQIDMYDSFYSFEYPDVTNNRAASFILLTFGQNISTLLGLIRNYTFINLNNAAYAIEKYENKQKFRQIINVDFSKFLF